MNDAYALDIVDKMWAAEKIEDVFRGFSNGLSVTTKIDKKSDGLEDKLKSLGLHDSAELNFSQAFSMAATPLKWPCDEPSSGFSAQQMFEVLRTSAGNTDREIASSFVGVLKDSVSVQWLTGTQNPRESVFKPFIFTSSAKISALTALKDGEDETMLRKLHANRKWDQVGDLLKTLEKSCVDEVDGCVDSAPTPELDELLKDCVEAEVKFYR
jgi:secernin